MESDAQWSQHKKLIDATAKGLRRSVGCIIMLLRKALLLNVA
jgi:hypothetical protein